MVEYYCISIPNSCSLGDLTMIFKKGELFSGPGGLALGAKEAGFVHEGKEYKIEHKWAYDYDIDSVMTFRKNLVPVELTKECVHFTVREGDVRVIDLENTEAIDAFSFGFPCNDFSNVGEKKGFNGEYGPLYSYGVKIIKRHNPKWFLAENVGGLQNAHDGYAFLKILNDLATAGDFSGYTLTPHLYKFEEYGVPQARHRIIIIGIRNDLDSQGIKFKVPAPTTPTPDSWKTARQALEAEYEIEPTNNEFTKHPQKTVDRLDAIPPGENAWYKDLPEHLQLNVKGARLSNIYKRLDPNKPAYTVTGSGGGGTHMYHYDDPRALTNRERARLQTFPDWYHFEGNKESVRKQIGMAVPPEGAKIIFNAILKTFAGIEYDYVDAKWNIDELIGEGN